MKFRQARKIIKNHEICNIGFNCPTIDKAIVVFIHHAKKNHKQYEKHGYIRELRRFYEKI